ncbi:hypothetical protein Ahia01_000520600 [Argonauta hians]
MNEFDPFKDYFQLSTIFWNTRTSMSPSSPFTNIKRKQKMTCESRHYLLTEKLFLDIEFKKPNFPRIIKIKDIPPWRHSQHCINEDKDNDYNDDNDGDDVYDNKVVNNSYQVNDKNIKNKENQISLEPLKLRQTPCAFCRKNGEQKEFYLTHCLKDQRGNVVCPVLKKYVCPNCGATGSTAHTKLYCPHKKHYISPVLSHLTPRMSSGKKRLQFL